MIYALYQKALDGLKAEQKTAQTGDNTALHQAKLEDKTDNQSDSTLYHSLIADSETTPDELFALAANQEPDEDMPCTPQNHGNTQQLKTGDREI